MFAHTAAVLTIQLLDAHRAVVRRLAGERGQGTVEYVGLILLVAGVLAAVVVWATKYSDGKGGIGQKVVDELKQAIDRPGKGKG